MKTEIYNYIQKLQSEIKLSKDETEKAEKLYWLMEAARGYEGEDKVISSLELAEKMKNAPPEEKMFSGFAGLDKILDGFRERQLVVISAATKSGKTSFCIDLTLRLKEKNPMWFPFEEGAQELIQKFLDRKEAPPLFFTPERMTGNTLTWVEKKIIEAKAKYDSKIIFIDHLHFVVDFGGENMSLEIGKTMRELKRLAKTWGVTIFLIAHLKKTQMENQPTLEDLRDSSFIAQEADTVMMLWRQTEKVDGQVVISDNVNLSVQANRRTGKTGNIKLVFRDGHFFEEAWINKADEELKDYQRKW